MNQTINVSIPKGILELAREQVRLGYFSSISEVFRHALRQFLLYNSRVPLVSMPEKLEKKVEEAEKAFEKGEIVTLNSLDEL